MGMFSEVLHEKFADDLLVVLKKGVDCNDISVLSFLKHNLYPLWESYMGNVYRKHTEEETFIINFYKNL